MIEKSEILNSLGGGVIKRNFKIVSGLTLVKLPAGLTVKDALKTFNKTDGILYAQPNYIYEAFSTFPNEPNFAQLWGMYNAGQLHFTATGFTSSGMLDSDVDAPEAWEIATGSNIIVAVIDSGVDYTHPDLNANMWTDANGCYGYDFVNDDNDLMDDYYPEYHGTHCAGIIGAVGNNGEGVTGICWNVKIMAVKFITYDGTGNEDDAIKCIEYAVDMGAKVMSNSRGGFPYSSSLESAIENAGAAGVLFVAAAGNATFPNNNDTNPLYPPSYDCNNIISVLATTDDDKKRSSSNYGATSVDLGALGDDILSCKRDEAYQYMSGTSMATPHVAGACALVWSEVWTKVSAL